jgi:hypothetical protein
MIACTQVRVSGVHVDHVQVRMDFTQAEPSEGACVFAPASSRRPRVVSMDDLLQLAAERGTDPLSVELASQHLSHVRGRYVSAHEALGEIEQMRHDGLLSPCAPNAYIGASTWAYVRITDAGREQAAQSIDAAAHRLWLQSDAR